MNRKVGYARVSTTDQNLDLQIDALKREGINEKDIYKDKISGSKKDRPGLDPCLKSLNPGDTLVVWKLDRLGRSLQDLIQIVSDLKKRGVYFKCLTESIDTTSPGGNLIFHIFGALAEFEKERIKERTKAGLASAKANGKVGGRPKLSPYGPGVSTAKQMLKSGCHIKEIARILRVSRRTAYRYVNY